ncbi:MAG: hypothetical protein KAH09_01105 [Desulfobacula sp.]|nr:hypothetical protein [Desulfobacula sp.]
MKIFVCVKHIPDTAATIKVAGANGFKDGDVKFISNPYDEYGIEEAVTMVERESGGGEKQGIEMSLPCVVGATKGLNEPRYPKFSDIMKAKKKRSRKWIFLIWVLMPTREPDH